jgi:microcystin degradation protein MlrC
VTISLKDAKLRVAIVGLSIEVMLSSPVVTGLDALQHYSAADLRDGDVWMVRGMLQRLDEEPGIEAVPLYWATALPGGPMTAEAYAAVKERTLALLAEEGPFDGVLVVNHGALEVEDLDADADTDFIVAVRQAIGPAVPMGVALDLHGDMTPALLDAATLFSVLRTAPHRDDRQTGYRAADQLVRVLREGLRPRKVAVSIPILVPGETAVTAMPPARDLYGSLARFDALPGIMEANILVGFAWNDRPWTAVNAIVVSEGDADRARAAALELAAEIWSQRHEFRLRMETAEVSAGLSLAAGCPERPVFVSDSGDNTTAGAAGDLTSVLQAVLDLPGAKDFVVAGITAPDTVARLLAAEPGSAVEIDLGVEHISRAKTGRRVTAIFEAGGETLELEGFQPYRSKEAAWARVRIDGVIATFHARAIGITTPQHFAAMGIDPTAHKAYVVKLGYLHPQLEDVSARHILLLSDGTSQLDLRRLEWSRLPRPVHPLDSNIAWTPESGLYGDLA